MRVSNSNSKGRQRTLGKQTVQQENTKGEKKTDDHKLFKRLFFLLRVIDFKILEMN